MRLNQEQAYIEAWEKSSIASGYASTRGVVDIKSQLNALPAPLRNTAKDNAEMADEQIARLEADVQEMQQTADD